ncbi:MAG TPA: hypothetical protein VNA89_10270 [Gemmatimonadaceae bacterium]|nr:hypothetical protein [Gemmatimonadaceae bacterium]
MEDGTRRSVVGSAARGRPPAALLLGAVVAAALLAGCGGDDAPLQPVAPCTGPVSLTATSEALPLFTWTPECGVARLTVLSPPVTGPPVLRWEISSLTGRIASGVRYGSVPDGAIQTVPPRALVAGQTTGVTVYDQAGVIIGVAPVLIP